MKKLFLILCLILSSIQVYAQIEFRLGATFENELKNFQKGELAGQTFKLDTISPDTVRMSIKVNNEYAHYKWVYFDHGKSYRIAIVTKGRIAANNLIKKWFTLGIIQDKENRNLFWNTQPSNSKELYLHYSEDLLKDGIIGIGFESDIPD
jgi:hypothetical protein